MPGGVGSKRGWLGGTGRGKSVPGGLCLARSEAEVGGEHALEDDLVDTAGANPAGQRQALGDEDPGVA
ncbi:MAG: hypothetical protein F4089_02630, partial [Gammaproteobacteria bacterium]|nr:hypothetical protein [Gammaproteobacteria bacterium]